VSTAPGSRATPQEDRRQGSLTEIASYRLTHYAEHPDGYAAEIRCYAAQDPYTEIANIRFYAEGTPVPPSSWHNGLVNGVPILTFPLSRLDEIITTIRDETYVVASWTVVNGKDVWYLAAGLEPTGDMDPS
jgi:hypothetical protein